MKHFIDLTSLKKSEIESLLVRSEILKSLRKNGIQFKPLTGKAAVLYFEKPSLRTKVSFDIGIQELGGTTTSLDYNMIAMGEREPVKDVARTLESYVDAIVCRIFKHENLYELSKWSNLSVVNALTDYSHPCQILADFQPLRENNLWKENLNLVWIGDPNNVLQSWLELALFYPFSITVSCPEILPEFDYWFQHPELKNRLTWIKNPVEAVKKADVIYLDTWISMGQEQFADHKRILYHGYTVNEKLLKSAPKHVQVLHCLPAKREEEITDTILEKFSDIIFQQAQNRLHIQKAIMWELLAPSIQPDSKMTDSLFEIKEKNYQLAEI